MLERIYRSTLVHEPGEAAVYGDLDFILLGAIVETVSGQPLDEFAASRIFAPLGMSDARFVRLGDGAPELPDALRRRFAATENCPWRGRVIWGEVHDPNAWAMGGVAGHAGLFATADDVMTLRAGGDRRLARPLRRVPARVAAALPHQERRRPRTPPGRSAGTRRRRARRRRASTSRRLRSATSASRAPRSGSTSNARPPW